MKKRLLVLFLGLTVLFCLTACGGTEVSTTVTFDEPVLLCEDGNISISATGINEGDVVLSITNKSAVDYYMGIEYMNINGEAFYDDGHVEEYYAGKTQEYTASFKDADSEYITNDFSGGLISAQFDYTSHDDNNVEGTVKCENVKVGNQDNVEQKEIDKGKLLGEDSQIAIYLCEVRDGVIYVNIENKTASDFYAGIDYVDIDGVTYTDGFNVTMYYAKQIRKTRVKLYDDDYDSIEYNAQKTFGGQYSYRSLGDGPDGTLKFDAVEIIK